MEIDYLKDPGVDGSYDDGSSRNLLEGMDRIDLAQERDCWRAGDVSAGSLQCGQLLDKLRSG